MNILVFTHLYKIKENKHLFEDTAAVHYFTKEWVKQGHRVFVIHMYDFNITNLKHIINTKKDIIYNIEGVEVFFLPRLRCIPKKIYYFPWQIRNHKKKILKYLDSIRCNLDVLICHFPMMQKQLVETLENEIDIPKIGVLHNTDMFLLSKDKRGGYNYLKNYFKGLGFRSKIIMDKFNTNIEISSDYNFIAYSGTPENVAYSTNLKKRNSILCVSKLIKRKNIDILIKALGEIKYNYKFNITIIGDGPEENTLKDLVKEMGLETRVVFIKHVSREKVLEEMNKSEIFALISKNETLGLVYLEALGSGNIVLASKGEGIDGIIVDQKNGYLIEPNNVDDLKKCLIRVFEMTEDQKENIVSEARHTAKQFSEYKVANTYINHVKKIVGKKNEYVH